MSERIIKLLPTKNDQELGVLRRNAYQVLDTAKDMNRKLQAEALLDAIDKELERRHLPGMIATFEEYYEDGFYGDRFREEERDYKLEASLACKALFEKEDFGQLISNADWDELFDRTKKLVNMTNLIQASFERPKLFDRIREAGVPETFYPSLFDCLHGPGDAAMRLGRFTDTLIDLGLGKWTYASYFLFLHEPECCMFVKPEGLKKSLEISQYPLDYESQPSEQLYREVLEFSRWLREKIRDLKPRDMIDVQSFIWHMAPTGIHTKD